MRLSIVTPLALSLFLLNTTQVFAEDGSKLAAKYNCLACHAVDKKIVGPSYKDVATKYRKQKDAEALLMQEIRSGVQGKWGMIPMPPQQISDADLRPIVRWILQQK